MAARKAKGTGRAHFKHLLRRAVANGWFVCVGCGLGVACPGCVQEVPAWAGFHFCSLHEALAKELVYRSQLRTVWAEGGSDT